MSTHIPLQYISQEINLRDETNVSLKEDKAVRNTWVLTVKGITKVQRDEIVDGLQSTKNDLDNADAAEAKTKRINKSTELQTKIEAID